MKKVIFLLIFLSILGVIGLRSIKERVKKDISQAVVYPSITSTIAPEKQYVADSQVTQSLFVPYWTVSSSTIDENAYDQYVYFGIVPGTIGLAVSDDGATNVDKFLSAVPEGKGKLLALRMLDAQQNTAILKDASRQKALIASTISFAQEHGFTGVVLDLELSAIPFDSLIKQVSAFNTDFAQAVKQQNLSFSVTAYGDTFYRLRPFDMQVIGKQADEVMIMAYDFHKARGNPGPNFPLNGQKQYGYDMVKLTGDLLKLMPAKKITVIFGMFGYDWAVDASGKSIGTGKPLADHEIKQKFLDSCIYTDCVRKRDPVSAETTITYTNTDGQRHVVWYEDKESVAMKQKYLKERGISSFSFWAYSYF